jgi:hypothetical protein
MFIKFFFSSLQKYSEHFSPFSCQLARDRRSIPSIFCCRLFPNSNFLCTKEKTITELIDENGQHITDPSEILLEQQHFYKTLYSSRNINDYDESFFNHDR